MEFSKSKSKKKQTRIDWLISGLTTWVGSIISICLHTLVFGLFFVLGLLGYNWNTLLLILTTIVSLEAIYLAIFIQMTVNRQSASLEEVEEDIEELQEDLDEIHEDDRRDMANDEAIRQTINRVQGNLEKLLLDIEQLKKDNSAR